jgi:hypothetical protein
VVSNEGGKAPQSQGTDKPWWQATPAIAAAVVLLGVVLVAGSVYTSRGGLFGQRNGSARSSSDLPAKTGDPNKVADKGEQLLRVVDPPNRTRVVIHLSKDLGKAVYRVQFQPYGLARNRTAVILIDKATVEQGNQLAEQFGQALTGQNMQVSLDGDAASTLKRGGKYSGRLALVDRKGATSFALSSVSPEQ